MSSFRLETMASSIRRSLHASSKRCYLSQRTRGRRTLYLDFFAGSGTTGEAVMETEQKTDGGNRRFIWSNSSINFQNQRGTVD